LVSLNSATPSLILYFPAAEATVLPSPSSTSTPHAARAPALPPSPPPAPNRNRVDPAPSASAWRVQEITRPGDGRRCEAEDAAADLRASPARSLLGRALEVRRFLALAAWVPELGFRRTCLGRSAVSIYTPFFLPRFELGSRTAELVRAWGRGRSGCADGRGDWA